MAEDPQPKRLKDNIIDLARNVDWTRSMARIVLWGLTALVGLLLAFMWGAVLIHGDDRGWLASVAVLNLIPGIEVPVQ